MKEVVIEDYQARLKGITFPVKNAEYRECDTCGEKSYHCKEIRRWEQLLKKYLKDKNEK